MARRSVFLAAVCLMALVAAAAATDVQMESEMEMEAEMGAEVQLPGFREQIAQQLRYFSQGTSKAQTAVGTKSDEGRRTDAAPIVQRGAAQRSAASRPSRRGVLPVFPCCRPCACAATHTWIDSAACDRCVAFVQRRTARWTR